MNVIPAQEIKRRGVKAIELALKRGPVHIIKNNLPTCVVLSEEDYAKLLQPLDNKKTAKKELVQWLLAKPSSGNKSRLELDQQIQEIRNEWDR